ncbi:hypothetical protein X975_19853, partial [Stegodyphus mimosarum]
MKIKTLHLTLLSLLLISDYHVSEAGNEKRNTKEVYIIRYLEDGQIIPVRVELDPAQQTEYVTTTSPDGADKSVSFYDFIQRKVAYKDVSTNQCFITNLTQESLEADRRKLLILKNGIVRGFYLPTFIIHKEVNSSEELVQNAGHRVASFCDGNSVAFVKKMDSQLHRIKRDVSTSGINGEKGQFTHHSYGHYGHQSNNYAHYGHETYVTGAVDKDGVLRNQRIAQR